jgi:hypothetical protein
LLLLEKSTKAVAQQFAQAPLTTREFSMKNWFRDLTICVLLRRRMNDPRLAQLLLALACVHRLSFGTCGRILGT